MRVAAIIAVGLLGACGGDESYELSVTVFFTADSAGVPGIEAFLDGQAVAVPGLGVSVVHDSYEAAMSAPPVLVELFHDGMLSRSEPVVAGGPRWCNICAADGELTFESISFPILVDSGQVFFGDGSYSCRAGEVWRSCIP